MQPQTYPVFQDTPLPHFDDLISSEFLAAQENEHLSALEEVQKELIAVRDQLAARDAECRAWQQQDVVLASLVAGMQRSWSLRLTAPMRAVARLFRSRGFDTQAVLPWQQLDPVFEAAPGTWKSTGFDPQFLVPCQLPAGWTHIRLRLSSEVRGRLELFADYGQGFQPAACLERAEVYDDVHLDFHVHLPAAVRALRLDPLDRPGQFRLHEFSAASLPAPRAWARAIRAKHELLREHGLVGACLKRGLRLLLRGQFGTFYHKLFRGLSAPTITGPDFANLNADYQVWRRRRQLTAFDRQRMSEAIAQMTDPPTFSVLLPVFNAPEKYLREAIQSVQKQNYPHWELCVADDGSTDARVRPVLEEYAKRDPRIRVVFLGENRGIAAASNAALELAEGDYIALLDHDDRLAEHALFRMAEAVVADRDIDFLYSDEDKIDPDGRHVEPFFKPDWSPELFQSCMYTCHLGAYRASLVRQLGGFRGGFDSAQDYDLVLRLIEQTKNIKHVPDVLYHWRKSSQSAALCVTAKPQAPEAGRRALQEHLGRSGTPGTVEPGALPGLHRVRHAIMGQPKVSIIIPSACRPLRAGGGKSTYHIVRCVESIRQKTTHSNFEVLLVHRDEDMTPALSAQLDRLAVRCVSYRGEFNWSAAMNRGAAAAAGDHFLFLNDDTEIITPDWIESLLGFSQQSEIGAVGAKLLFANGELQHAGVLVADGTPRHAFYRFPGPFPGYFSNVLMQRNCAAVTGACLMTRADLFRSLGGFSEELALNYSDIDYCLRVLGRGRRVVYTPYAQLYHHESSTKAGTFETELNAFRQRWQGKWSADPYYNPNLSSHFHDYRIDLGQGG